MLDKLDNFLNSVNTIFPAYSLPPLSIYFIFLHFCILKCYFCDYSVQKPQTILEILDQCLYWTCSFLLEKKINILFKRPGLIYHANIRSEPLSFTIMH